MDGGQLNPATSNLPVQFSFSNDFKSAALWTLLGVIGGVMLAHWLTSTGKKNLFS